MTDTTAELLDRYLGAVGALLPGTQRADILAEIKAALLSRLEARQAQLGRPLTVEDGEGVIKAYGHPVAVAAPYREQRPLIGPLVLPWYWLILRVVLAISWIAALVHGAIAISSGQPMGQLLGHLTQLLLSSAVQVTGTVTIIAVILDRLGAEVMLAQGFVHLQASWRPRDLPRPIAAAPSPTPGWMLTWDLIGLGLVVLWVAGALDAMLPSEVTHVQPAAILEAIRWPLLVVVVARIVVYVLAALRAPQTLRVGLSVTCHVAVLMGLAILLRHWPLIEVVGPSGGVAAGVAHGLNLSLGIVGGLIALLTVGGLLGNIGNLRSAPQGPGGGLPASQTDGAG